jgi:hypothetical protein
MEYEFLSPLIHKIAWRYMQFDTERYPVADYRFKVHGALGAQAREFEVAQLTQLLQTTPAGSPAYWIILKGVLKNYNVEDKETLIKIMDMFLQRALNPEPPQPDFDQQVKMAEQQRKAQEFQFNVQKSVRDDVRKAMEVEAEAERDRGEAIWNQSEAILNVEKAKTERIKAESDAVYKQAQSAKALVGEEGTPAEYLALVDALKDSFATVTNSAVNKINTTLADSINHLSSRQQIFNTGSTNIDPINAKLDKILQQQQETPDLNITRDAQGKVSAIGGRPVKRGPNGELRGVE